jgi:hypothetical protein
MKNSSYLFHRKRAISYEEAQTALEDYSMEDGQLTRNFTKVMANWRRSWNGSKQILDYSASIYLMEMQSRTSNNNETLLSS